MVPPLQIGGRGPSFVDHGLQAWRRPQPACSRMPADGHLGTTEPEALGRPGTEGRPQAPPGADKGPGRMRAHQGARSGPSRPHCGGGDEGSSRVRRAREATHRHSACLQEATSSGSVGCTARSKTLPPWLPFRLVVEHVPNMGPGRASFAETLLHNLADARRPILKDAPIFILQVEILKLNVHVLHSNITKKKTRPFRCQLQHGFNAL